MTKLDHCNIRTFDLDSTIAFYTDVVELRDGGAPLDPANVLLLCRPCHARKTNRARDERLSIA